MVVGVVLELCTVEAIINSIVKELCIMEIIINSVANLTIF